MLQARRPVTGLSLLALILNLFAIAPVAAAQEPSARALLESLKPELREQGAALLAETDERKRAQLSADMARRDPAGSLDFLLAFISTEKSALVRRAIVDRLGRHSHAKVGEMLERLAASDPDAEVAVLALERLRFQRSREMFALLLKRLEMARRDGDEAGAKRLAAEHERWISLVRGTMLPSFLRVPPPLFSLKPEGEAVRVLVFGDFGSGFSTQRKTAEAMAAAHRKRAFDFGLTVGDNFYDSGMESHTTSRWKMLWDDMYGSLGIKVYATLGNHDWILPDSPAAEILHSDRSPTWRMPSPYYTFKAGPVQFFALDTNEVSEAQLMWLDEELKKRSARWKIVYGHHPIYSDGYHGDNAGLIARLLPILKGRVDIYLAGHDHILQHLKSEAGVHFFISGGGGAGLYRVAPKERSLFAQSAHGFTTLDADANRIKVAFVGSDSKLLYEYTLSK
ncbi:MAG TPA: metallophosphoesterase [Blastocatellia bacterium]|nr:metallophosphoesterase [Blastocatellia bacterium]